MRINRLFAVGTLLLLTGIVPLQADSSYPVGLRALAAKVPERGKAIETKSLNAIQVPVQLIALGRNGPSLSGLQQIIPHARYATIPDAAPFSAFSRCTRNASAVLAEEGEDDAICRDGGNRSREEVQVEIGSIIEAALAAELQK
jgi:predicted dienelactone hydrolase